MSGLIRQLQAAAGGKKTAIMISTPQASWSMASALSALGVDVTRPVDVTVTVANITTGPMTFESVPAGSRVRLINNGNIYGTRNGGTALRVLCELIVTNHGTIAGGGGRGGSGASVTHSGMPPSGGTSAAQCTSMTLYGGSGGSGAGMVGTSYYPANGGSSGSSAATDAGSRPGAGGSGGALGQSGSSGSGGYNGSSNSLCGPYTGSYVSGSSGSSAGYYIDGNRFVTWESAGNRLGRVLN